MEFGLVSAMRSVGYKDDQINAIVEDARKNKEENRRKFEEYVALLESKDPKLNHENNTSNL